ncbi:MAG: isoprenyl transferase [Acidobacteriota bacterium]
MAHKGFYDGPLPPGSVEESLVRQIDFTRLPRHVAIIMDGNGRWAKSRHLPRVEGHRAGIGSVRDTVETSARLGLEALTLYAFSVENWKRPKAEIDTLMALLREFLRRELETLKKNNIRFQPIGRIHGLPASVQRELAYAVRETKDMDGLLFQIALNYGGRTEIVDAVNELLGSKGGAPCGHTEITEEEIVAHLYAPGTPDPDLLIRTSGEMRVSNFLLWQIAYSEIWVTSTLWPDFRKRELFTAIIEYQGRERRYGGVTSAVQFQENVRA